MRHRVERIRPHVDDEAVAPLAEPLLPRDLLRRPHYRADKRVILRPKRLCIGHVAIRHDQHVRRHLRVDVAENGHLRVLVNNSRRNLTSDDLAEQAVRVHGHSRPPIPYSPSAATSGEAVSVRKIRGPRVISRAPIDTASSTSSGANPPSGPTNTDTAD